MVVVILALACFGVIIFWDFGPEEVENRSFRLIPLGDPPPWKEEMRGGKRVRLPASEGALPPSLVSFGRGMDGELLSLSLNLKVGESVVRPVVEGGNWVKVGYLPSGGGTKRIFEEEMTIRRGDRVQCFFHADLRDFPRDEVKFTFIVERAADFSE